jgi:hypothetical protein
LEIETQLKDNVSLRNLEERYKLGRNIFMKHKNTCMNQAPSDAQSQLKLMADNLKKDKKWKDAAVVYTQIINAGDNTEDVYGFLNRISERLCPECKSIILKG